LPVPPNREDNNRPGRLEKWSKGASVIFFDRAKIGIFLLVYNFGGLIFKKNPECCGYTTFGMA
jgi:hypothetical protein